MAARIQKSSSARRDLLEHFIYLNASSEAVAKRFLRSAGKTITLLGDMPEIAGFWESENPQLVDIRVWPIRDFERYLIFYRVRSDGIRILRILHASQDIDQALSSR